MRPTAPAGRDSRGRLRPGLSIPVPRREPSPPLPLPLPLPSPAFHLPDLDRLRRIGSGSGGTVYLVRHRPTSRLFALKIIHGTHDANVVLQMRREIEILRAVDHPSVVRCYAMFDHASEIQLLLEYMDRGSLQGHRCDSEHRLAEIASQILHGLAYLHRRKIVHRDIKPSNLLLDGSSRVKIADFGVSRILSQSMDPCNSAVGTVQYMSPERINTDDMGNYDGCAADIWSFGISMLEIYLGRLPFGEAVGDFVSLMCAICYSEPPEAPSGASPEFRSFVSSCLQKEPRRRLTAAALLQHPFIARQQANSVLLPLPLPPTPS